MMLSRTDRGGGDGRASDSPGEPGLLLDALVRASPLAIITLDPEGRVTTWNPAAERIFGWRVGEALGGPQPNIPEGLWGEHESALEASSRGEAWEGFETRRLRRDGACVDVEVWTAPLLGVGGDFSGRLAIVADVTARNGPRPSGRNCSAGWRLRRRTSVAGSPASCTTRWGSTWPRRCWESRPSRDCSDEARESREAWFVKLQEAIHQLGSETHRIALELRPTALDDLGLHSALLNYVEEWSERSRVEVDFQTAGLELRRLDPELETALYRIVQEALTNVVRHAHARHVGVVLECRQDLLVVIVEDDGEGFDVESVLASASLARKMGLMGMRERVALVGGTMEIESGAGQGTTLLVRVPLVRDGKVIPWTSCESS